MRKVNATLAGAVFALIAYGQRYPLPQAKQPEGRPEGQWRIRRLTEIEADLDLENILVHASPEARLPLLEAFAARHPKHPAYPWALEQQQIIHLQARHWAEVLAVGEKLLEFDPGDTDAFRRCWEAVEQMQDAGLRRQWCERAWKFAQAVEADPKAPEAGRKQAAQIAAEAEYTLYRRAFESKDSAARLKAVDELLALIPKTRYRREALALHLSACRQLHDPARTLASAERLLKEEPDNEEALAVAAQHYLERRTDLDKAAAYARRLLSALRVKRKPDTQTAAGWEQHKALYTGSAHLILGSVYLARSQFVEADQALRTALPLLRGNDQPAAAILFYLGWSNYNLERYAEAAAFFKQCLSINSQYQAQALKNLDVMRRERRIED